MFGWVAAGVMRAVRLVVDDVPIPTVPSGEGGRARGGGREGSGAGVALDRAGSSTDGPSTHRGSRPGARGHSPSAAGPSGTRPRSAPSHPAGRALEVLHLRHSAGRAHVPELPDDVGRVGRHPATARPPTSFCAVRGPWHRFSWPPLPLRHPRSTRSSVPSSTTCSSCSQDTPWASVCTSTTVVFPTSRSPRPTGGSEERTNCWPA